MVTARLCILQLPAKYEKNAMHFFSPDMGKRSFLGGRLHLFHYVQKSSLKIDRTLILVEKVCTDIYFFIA